ncbi:DNA modification methylase [Microbacterium sp. ARD31]|uniref:DNA modification methylase n=1 Tax=Microbacterium sp. ARD31 TaxID=2962576 RepID=UPI0028828E42|nr:DNA modification methylase [Microbacterium sp. ARD31]MDT0180275.1 DNA modification methylase [Microbacterium sp. ARD31]
MSKHRSVGGALTAKRSRVLASLAVGVAVAIGTTGCSMISTQATTIEYNASDGVAADAGPIEVRNALVVATEDGSAGNMLAAIVNSTDSSETLTIEIGEGSSKVTETLQVPANSVVSLGADGEEPLLIEALDTMPGADVPVYFQAGDAEGSLVAVPVLDGALEYYAPFVP